MDKDQQPIIKKVKKVSGGGHHGGAWKIAYADFVTAMMAFFLLMWLLNATNEKQKLGIANYFSPNLVAPTTTGGGGTGPLGGEALTKNDKSIRVLDATEVPSPPIVSMSMGDGSAEQEEKAFKEIKETIEKTLAGMPELKDLMKHLIIEDTPEGLRIQVVDQDHKPMFPSGSSKMYPEAEKLFGAITNIIKKTPNKITITGHTDATAYSDTANYTNWELSSDRANACRRVMVGSGMAQARIQGVVGKEAKDLLIKDDPMSPKNRRISIVLLRQFPRTPPSPNDKKV